MSLLLSHNLDDADEDELCKPATKVRSPVVDLHYTRCELISEQVEVNLSLSALANAGVYYQSKKKSATKQVYKCC